MKKTMAETSSHTERLGKALAGYAMCTGIIMIGAGVGLFIAADYAEENSDEVDDGDGDESVDTDTLVTVADASGGTLIGLGSVQIIVAIAFLIVQSKNL